jgi:hypothetical protein
VLGVKVWIYKGEIFDLHGTAGGNEAGAQKAAS